MQNPKTFFIRTYGCQMNELDTDIMSGMLKKRGLERVEDEDKADILLFNTCSVRDLAERKVMGKLGQIGRSKKKNKIIGVTGCMANNKKDSLFKKIPFIDFVLGTNNIHDLNQILDDILHEDRKQIKTDPRFTHELDYAAADRSNPLKAFVSIIRGCDKYCTYCVVPYTRGKEVSRDPQSIIDECKELFDKGYKEITLLGQNVNSYGKDKPENKTLFHDLLSEIDKLGGKKRIRFMTSHPCDITQELMFAIRDLPSLCELVHFPMQAGSDRILKKMHRIYTIAEYLDKVEALKKIVPNVKLGTDIIVGFPTESEDDFRMTKELMEKIRFSIGFIFAYSPRKGTPATRWVDDIPEEVKQDRLQQLLDVQEIIYLEERQEMIGTEVEVLLEKQNYRDTKYLKGHTRCWKNVIVEAPKELIGTFQTVKIHSTSFHTLIGSLKTCQNNLAIAQ